MIQADYNNLPLAQKCFHYSYGELVCTSTDSKWKVLSNKIRTFGRLILCVALETLAPRSVSTNCKALKAKITGSSSQYSAQAYQYSSKIKSFLMLKPFFKSQKKAIDEIGKLSHLNPALAEKYLVHTIKLFNLPALKMGEKRKLKVVDHQTQFTIKLSQLPKKKLTEPVKQAISFFKYQLGHDQLSFFTYEELKKKTIDFRAIDGRMEVLLNLLVEQAQESFLQDAERLRLQFRIDTYVVKSFEETSFTKKGMTLIHYTQSLFASIKQYYLDREHHEYSATKYAAMALFLSSQAGQAEFIAHARDWYEKVALGDCSVSVMPLDRSLYHKYIELNPQGFRILNKQSCDFTDVEFSKGQSHVPLDILLEISCTNHKIEMTYLVEDINVRWLGNLIKQDIESNVLFYFSFLKRQAIFKTINVDYLKYFLHFFNHERFFLDFDKSLAQETNIIPNMFCLLSFCESDLKQMKLLRHNLLQDPYRESNKLVAAIDILKLSQKNALAALKVFKKMVFNQLLEDVKWYPIEVYVLGNVFFNKKDGVTFQDINRLYKRLSHFFSSRQEEKLYARFHALENLVCLSSLGFKRCLLPLLVHKAHLLNDYLNLSPRYEDGIGFFELILKQQKSAEPKRLYIAEGLEKQITEEVTFLEKLSLCFVPNLHLIINNPKVQEMSVSMSHHIFCHVYLIKKDSEIRASIKKYASAVDEFLDGVS